jgi:hypothetical protein
MTQREFTLSCIPGLEQDLEGAKQSLDEFAYQEWAEQFDKLPEGVLRELWRKNNGRV